MLTLGLLVPTRPGAPPGAPEDRPLGRAALLLAAEGVDVVLGDHVEQGCISGHRARPGRWEPATARAAAFYDRFPSQARASDFAAIQAGLGGRLLANPPWLTALCRDKLALQRHLEAAGLPMPQVEHDPACFAAALDAWGAAFLKPRFGAMGAGVRRVLPGDPLPATVRGLQGEEPALLQRAVTPPAGLAGRSVRVLAQRRPEGGWHLAPTVVRESAEDPVVNAARGARVRLAEDVLTPATQALLAARVQAATAALSASPVGAHALELGLDLVLDPEGEPHLIEVNARPNGRLEVLASQDPTRFATAHLDACLRPLRTLAAWAG